MRRKRDWRKDTGGIVIFHTSLCSVHKTPYPMPGHCDCGVLISPPAKWTNWLHVADGADVAVVSNQYPKIRQHLLKG